MGEDEMRIAVQMYTYTQEYMHACIDISRSSSLTIVVVVLMGC